MLIGEFDPHRHDLRTNAMLKDNHIWSVGGSIAAAVAAVRAVSGFSIKVKVECQSATEAHEATKTSADVRSSHARKLRRGEGSRCSKRVAGAVGRPKGFFSRGERGPDVGESSRIGRRQGRRNQYK